MSATTDDLRVQAERAAADLETRLSAIVGQAITGFALERDGDDAPYGLTLSLASGCAITASALFGCASEIQFVVEMSV